jgi:hypothetical protein
MTTAGDTPAELRATFGQAGRPLSDWEVLAEVWNGSATLREACGSSFATMVAHAYQDLGTDDALTQQVWAEIESAGFVVDQPKPIHFLRPAKQGLWSKVMKFGRRAGTQVVPPGTRY